MPTDAHLLAVIADLVAALKVARTFVDFSAITGRGQALQQMDAAIEKASCSQKAS